MDSIRLDNRSTTKIVSVLQNSVLTSPFEFHNDNLFSMVDKQLQVSSKSMALIADVAAEIVLVHLPLELD